jgi:hypothetical protein
MNLSSRGTRSADFRSVDLILAAVSSSISEEAKISNSILDDLSQIGFIDNVSP